MSGAYGVVVVCIHVLYDSLLGGHVCGCGVWGSHVGDFDGLIECTRSSVTCSLTEVLEVL
jgi:hypothetical protein